jgi:glycosyltransferase involved in cell wall biosynthesis
LLRDNVDLLHSPGYTTPIITHCKKITTIFDLNYHFHPKTFSFIERFVYSVLIPLGAYTSSKIIVHSNKAKEEMIKVLGINKNKIEVIYGGVPEEFKKVIPYSKALRVVKGFNVEPPFILANATIHPHKNLDSLVRAFIVLAQNKRFVHKLVLLGVYGRSYSEIDQLVNENGIADRVRFTGWIDHSDTMYFNRVADIFVMPSLYEGFGLPTAEAMACGTPVVASKYSCTPEIVGNGGLVVDVKNPKIIAKSIKELLGSKEKREKLAKLGRERAKIFSWKELGRKIYNLYNV